MDPVIELVPLSAHEWLVADEERVLGTVEEHAGDYEALFAGGSAWHPHFDSLGAATMYFSEYSSALHLGCD
jgi:hypothetical protein